jgi:ATP-dependent RNA helicase DDX27
MDPSFRFDPDSSDDEAAGAPVRGGPAQSPWEFSSYAESVAAEHARRRTTSIDEKISHLRQGRGKPVLSDDSESDASGSGEDGSDEEEIEGESGDEEDELEESEDEDGVDGGDDEEEEVEGSGDVEASGDREGDEDGSDEEGRGELEEEDGHEVCLGSLIPHLVLFCSV